MTAVDRPVVASARVSQPFASFPRPDRCEAAGHPGCTYNPWLNQTVCLCGARWMPGNQDTFEAKLDGPLVSDHPRPDTWQPPVGSWCTVLEREPQQLNLFGAVA